MHAEVRARKFAILASPTTITILPLLLPLLGLCNTMHFPFCLSCWEAQSHAIRLITFILLLSFLPPHCLLLS